MQAEQADEETVPCPVPVETVLATIRASTSHSKDEREPAEQMLRSWEADAAPGFLHSLLLIVGSTVDEVGGLWSGLWVRPG